MTSTRLREVGLIALAAPPRPPGRYRHRPRRRSSGSPGRSRSDERRRPSASRFLSRSIASSTASVVDRRVERGRAGRAASSSPATSSRSSPAPERRSAASRPSADRLAVAVAAVAGRRLDRVADGVAEVEHLAAARVALVGGDDVDLRAGAVEDHVVELVGVERRRARAPAPRARRPRSAPSSRPRRSRPRAPRPAASQASPGRRARPPGMVVGADVVLGLGQVDAGLAAVGGVDLGDQRRRHLDHRHAALVGGGAEAGEVADDAAAEGEHAIVARVTRPAASSRSTRSASASVFAGSPAGDLDRGGDGGHGRGGAAGRRRRRSRDQKRRLGERPRQLRAARRAGPRPTQAPGTRRRRRRGPGQAGSRRAARACASQRAASARATRSRAGGQDRVGELARTAAGARRSAASKSLAVAGQRPVGPLAARPGGSSVDPAPDDDVARRAPRALARRLDAAAAERDQRRRRPARALPARERLLAAAKLASPSRAKNSAIGAPSSRSISAIGVDRVDARAPRRRPWPPASCPPP